MNRLLGRQLAMAHKAVHAEVDARLIEAGGSLSTWIVLRSAEESAGGGGLSQRALAERMGVEGPTLVRHLDRLEKAGLIERRPDLRDRRVTRIGVTPSGQALLKELAAVAEGVDGEIQAVIGPNDYDVVMGALEAVRAHMACQAAERRTHGHGA
ncbi:MAG: MarR family transcriptional regulator [Actinomycetota bacterium]